jgi:hypothetical protein
MALAPRAAPGLFYYSSNATNNSYILSTYENYTWAQASSFCNDNGGHLASWLNLEEQLEVEKYYVGMVRGLGRCCLQPARCVLMLMLLTGL